MNLCNFHQNISWTVVMNMQMSDLMMSSPHNLPCILFTEMTKIPYFSYEKVKLAILSILNKCKILFALIYFDMGRGFYMFEQKRGNFQISYTKYMGNCEVMRSSTHSFAFTTYSYQLFKKFFVENYEHSNFISYVFIRLTSNFHCSI